MRRPRMVALVAAGCILAAGCSTSEGSLPVLSASAPVTYQVGPGDELRISVPGLDAMNNSYRVDDTGAIAVPMLDPVPVSGKTLRELEAAIAGEIKNRGLVLDPKVSAQVLTYRPFFIAGQVQKPGQYPYVPGMSLMTAVSVAGGYTFRANTKSATITRASAKGQAKPDTPVLPGDLIVVSESWF